MSDNERNGWEEEKYSTQLEHQLTSLISTNNKLTARVAELEAENGRMRDAIMRFGLAAEHKPGSIVLPERAWATLTDAAWFDHDGT